MSEDGFNDVAFDNGVKLLWEDAFQNFHEVGDYWVFTVHSGTPDTQPGYGLFPFQTDIDLDGASLLMTTDQLVPLTHERSKVKDLDPKFRTDSSGKQIILNSDRIVFNSRKNAFLYSDNDINLVSKNRIVLEGHEKVYLGSAPEQGKTTGFPSGDVPQIEPVLKGDQTMDLVDKLIDYLIEFSTTMQSAKGSVVDFVVPVSGIHEGCTGLQGTCEQLIEDLDKEKSDIVKTV